MKVMFMIIWSEILYKENTKYNLVLISSKIFKFLIIYTIEIKNNSLLIDHKHNL